jgi:hypothetical protein
MRHDVQEIFRVITTYKQVLMFSATLSKDIRVTCKKFMNNVNSLSSNSAGAVVACFHINMQLPGAGFCALLRPVSRPDHFVPPPIAPARKVW